MEAKAIENAVRLACRAPSLLFLDARRVLHGDRLMRVACIGCGGALGQLRVATAAASWTAELDRFAAPDNPAHLTRAQFGPADRVSDNQRRRADPILKRRTDRLPLLAPNDRESFEPVLRSRLHAATLALEELTQITAEAAQQRTRRGARSRSRVSSRR